jgi:phytoene synthase
MMCVLMRVRDSDALARACDLGVAMQLTNIARDVGEDARAGRLYLPLDWMEQAGIAPKTFLADPLPTPEIRRMTARLIAEAERLYRRSEAGIARLPPAARTGIWAARLIYAGIGTRVRRAGCDSVSHRAHTSSLQKSFWMAQAALRAAGSTLMPEPAVIYAPPLPETAYLVAAAGRASPRGKRTQTLLAILADLKSRDARLGSGPQQA